MKCKKKDCFNCPYPDCINDSKGNAEAKRRYYLKNREKILEYNRQRRRKIMEERRVAGICTQCGKRPLAQNSKARCLECLLKHRRWTAENRRKKGIMSKDTFDGEIWCAICGKEKPVEGHRVCEKCLENTRKSEAYDKFYRKRF